MVKEMVEEDDNQYEIVDNSSQDNAQNPAQLNSQQKVETQEKNSSEQACTRDV